MSKRELMIIKKCAEFAAIYWNSAGLQRDFTIEEFIIMSMEDVI